MGFRRMSLQLMDRESGRHIMTSGGTCYVATQGSPAKATLYDHDAYTAISNPVTATAGQFKFAVADTVQSVDVYIMTPGGEFVVKHAITEGLSEIYVDREQTHQTAVIPFAIADTAAATETDTGFDLPVGAAVAPLGVTVDVTTVDATETIDVGILASESGDADGFLDGISVANAVRVGAATTITTGSNNVYVASTTLGLLLMDLVAGEDTAAGGDGSLILTPHVMVANSQSISYTLSAGTDTAAGFIMIDYVRRPSAA